MLTLNLRGKGSPSREQPPWNLLQIAAGAFLGCVLTLLLPWLARTFSYRTSAIEVGPLAAKLGPMRLTMGRLGDQVTYAPYPTPLRRQDSLYFARLCRQAIAGNASPTAEELRNQAICELARKRLDAAVAHLEEAVQMEPGDAQLLSDLSAMYGERARAEDQPDDYSAALQMAERAFSVAPSLQQIVFNRAVALEHLFLFEKAAKEWQRYLKIDAESGWAEEARKHLEQLAGAISLQPTSSNYRPEPQEPHEIFEEILMPDWASAMARGEEGQANRNLERAQQIAQSLANQGGDRIFLEIVQEMEAARVPSGRQRAAILVDSFGLFGAGQVAFHTRQLTQATREFEASEQELGSIHSAAILLVRFRLAQCKYLVGKTQQARADVVRLGQDRLLSYYPSLEARRQWMLGLSAQVNAAPSDAIISYRNALQILNRLGDKKSAAIVQTLIAESLNSLGQSTEAWRYLYSTLAWSSAQPADPLLIGALNGAVLSSLALHRPDVALDLQDHLILLAGTLRLPSEEVISCKLRRARIEVALGKKERAKQDFERARDEMRQVPEPARRQLLAASIEIVRSEIDESEDRATFLGWDFFSPPGIESLGLMGARADFDLRRGDTGAAEQDLGMILDQLEQQRVASGSYRISFLDQAQPLYERAVSLQLNLGHPEKALEVLEHSRARALLDQLKEIAARNSRADLSTNTFAAPLGWREICSRMPAHTVIVVYAVIEGRLVTWLIRPSGVEGVAEQTWDTVSALVQSLRWTQGREQEIGRILEQLHHDLVDSWKTKLADGDRIIFVPTRLLYQVPFAALLDPISGHFLVQDHPVGIAPSASEFIAAMERDRQISVVPPASALLVGNPRMNSSAAEFPPLPGTAEEIERLSGIYQGLDTTALMGPAATPAKVLASLEKAEVVHLAVHGIQDSKDPTRSHLVLSSTESNPGFLFAQDVLHLHLPRTRVVVLAACDTGAGLVSPSEGALSLASSFLAAGVPAVVGTLRQVEDASTARLSVRFHQELRRGADALSALRTAQLEEIARQRGRFDWTWASFQVFGGVAERVPGASSVPSGQSSTAPR